MEKILVIGACGQLGVELTLALREQYGSEQVIASDLKVEHALLKGTGPFLPLDVCDRTLLQALVRNRRITQIYHLAAVLSASGEKDPLHAWDLNMQSLLNVLEVAREEKINKVFWPSSIAVFGATTPRDHCPQLTVMEPSTIYGISKQAGEQWCAYYHQRYQLDVRSVRYPGLISYQAAPGGGTTDYAVDIFHQALARGRYTCFLHGNTKLPMLYMPDAIRATIELMQVPPSRIRVRTSYNIAGCSFTPADIADAIREHIPTFQIDYRTDHRQFIASSWPQSIDDNAAQRDWGWKAEFTLPTIVQDMLHQLKLRSVG